MEDHLYATTRDFVLAEDEPRAQALLDYVTQKYGEKALSKSRWKELILRFPSKNGLDGETLELRAAKARAKAQLDLSSATTLTGDAMRVTDPQAETPPR